eukprot:COSAG01_NODE_8066_length_2933_cov_3.447424_5_plen_46_part_01
MYVLARPWVAVCVWRRGGRDAAPVPSSAELHEAVEEEVHPLYAHEV